MRLRWLVLLTLCVGALGQGAVPATYFGLTVQDFRAVAPVVLFGTVRTWDAFDGGWNHAPGLDWAHIETARGKYDFAAVDRYLDWAEKHHAEVIYTFGRTPGWASAMPDRMSADGVGECGAPANMADWDDFVHALATHVHGRVSAWELWNEPNDPASYCGDVATMVHMAKDARRILKSVDARARVLSPGVVSDGGPAWLAAFLEQGGRETVDAIAFHGYWSGVAEDLLPLVARYKELARGKPLWDTEASWAGRNGGRGGLTDLDEQAAFLAKYELLHWSLGVERFVWYAYDGQEIWGRLWSRDKDQLLQDGHAYEETYDWMVGRTLVEPCHADEDGTWRCRFHLPRGQEGMALWNSTREVMVDGSQFRRIRFLDGLSRTIQASGGGGEQACVPGYPGGTGAGLLSHCDETRGISGAESYFLRGLKCPAQARTLQAQKQRNTTELCGCSGGRFR